MNIDDFEIPEDDGDYPITSAEEILQQTRRALSTEECIVYSIYSADHMYASWEHAYQLLNEIQAFLKPLTESYIWSRETIDVHIVEDTFKPETGGPVKPYCYLQGCTIYGDCIDDEWFVVYLMHKLSEKIPNIYIKISDRDGEFLLIEAADTLPRWVQPENAANRVWMRRGKMHLLSDDGFLPDSDGTGGINLTAARRVMGAAACECAAHENQGLSKSIEKRISVFPEQHLALRHTANVILPRKCAAVLTRYPTMVSAAVATLCDGEESTKKDIAGMSCIGAADFVVLPIVFTRIQYAQLMFQNLEIPALLKLAEKRLNFTEKRTAKAFDVGVRLACGTEAVFQKARKLRPELKEWDRVHKHPQWKHVNCLREEGLSEYIAEANMRCLTGVEDRIHNSINAESQEVSDLIVMKANDKLPAIGGKGESDSWLYLTPEAMDKELAERVGALKGQQAGGGGDSNRGDQKAQTPSADFSSPALPSAEPLQNVVAGLEKFIAGKSGVDGVEIDGDRDSDYFSSDSDSEDAADSDEEDGKYDTYDDCEGGLAGDDGDIVLNIEKLMYILEEYQLGTDRSGKEKKVTKSKNKLKKTETIVESSSAPQKASGAAVISGTATCILSGHRTTTSESGVCVVEDVSDESSSDDSDDASSEEDMTDEDFYKEYQDAMDGELSGTTLEESFLRQKDENINDGLAAVSGNPPAESGAAAVNEDLNMLTHLLESHASQFGTNGPVANLLSAMGIRLPNVDLNSLPAPDEADESTAAEISDDEY